MMNLLRRAPWAALWIASAWTAGLAGAQGTEDLIPGFSDIEAGDFQIRSSRDRDLRQILADTPNRHEALRVGERLVFSVRYGPIRAGEAVLEIPDVVQLPDGPAFRILSVAESNSLFDSFYKVRDRVESHMDSLFLFSRRHEKHLREGKYTQDRSIVMDQQNRLAVYDDGKIFEMPSGAHDVLTAFYYVRTMDLEVGDVIRLDSHVDRKNYPIEVTVLRREKVEVPAGTFDCLVIEPKVSEGALFKSKGKLTIWITDDDRKIPVLMKTEIPVGSIDALLVRIEGR